MDPPLEGLPLAHVVRIVQDVIELVQAVSGVAHYRLEQQHLSGDRTVLLIHQTPEGAAVAVKGACAPHFPQRIAVSVCDDGERNTVRAVWVLFQSPLPCARTGRLFPPEERTVRRAGDLNDFLLVHLCTSVSTLHVIQSLLETFTPPRSSSSSKEGEEGEALRLREMADRIASAIHDGLQIDLQVLDDHADAAGTPNNNDGGRALFVARSLVTERHTPIYVRPSLELVLPHEALSPRAMVARVGAAFRTTTTHDDDGQVLAPIPSVATAFSAPRRRGFTLRTTTGAAFRMTHVPSVDGPPPTPEEAEDAQKREEKAEEYKDRPEAYIEHSFLVDADEIATAPLFHEQTATALAALVALLLPS